MPRKKPAELFIDDDEEVIDALDEDDDDYAQTISYSITSYGVDYPIDGIVSRLNSETILVPPFQRQFVWNFRQASRFIESLLLGLPVPGIFLSKERDTQKQLVIDGQQRLLTLKYFYGGKFPGAGDTWRDFALRGVQNQFKGATYSKLKPEERLKLNDSIIHATIVQQDEPEEDDSSIYYIFERLNTGGTQLTPQEIRACVYHGNLHVLLSEMNSNQAWRQIFGRRSKRMRDCELILRFLALYYMADEYEPPMNEFLNKFMHRHKNPSTKQSAEFRQLFANTISVALKAMGKTAFKPRKTLNAAVFDSVMVGLARLLQRKGTHDPASIKRKYYKLVQNPAFQAATEKGTATADAVESRIRLATQTIVG